MPIATKKIISAESKFEEIKHLEKLIYVCKTFLHPPGKPVGKKRAQPKVDLEDPDTPSIHTPARKSKKNKKAVKKASPEREKQSGAGSPR